jgi:hypothetical protein
MFAYAFGEVEDESLVLNSSIYGAAKMEWKGEHIYYTPVKISGGKVEIPMYIDGPKLNFKAYHGNGFLNPEYRYYLTVRIVTYDTPTTRSYYTVRKNFGSETFVNGSLIVEWEDGRTINW